MCGIYLVSWLLFAVLDPVHPRTIKHFLPSFSILLSLMWEKLPGPLLLFHTASDRKLGGVWEWGYTLSSQLFLLLMWDTISVLILWSAGAQADQLSVWDAPQVCGGPSPDHQEPDPTLSKVRLRAIMSVCFQPTPLHVPPKLVLSFTSPNMIWEKCTPPPPQFSPLQYLRKQYVVSLNMEMYMYMHVHLHS